MKAVIFDLNGVLIQSEYLSKRIEDKFVIASEKFLEILKDILSIARRPGCEDSFKLWEPKLKELGLSISKDDFFNFWFSGENLVLELIDYIKELKKKGIKVFILSNNFKERTEYYRQNFPQIFDHIDRVYFSWETGFIKPDIKAYQKLLVDNNLRAEDLVYFDDADKNLQIASSLGIKSYKYINLENTKEIINNLL